MIFNSNKIFLNEKIILPPEEGKVQLKYEKKFFTHKDSEFIKIFFNAPFANTQVPGTTPEIILYLDDEPVYYEMLYARWREGHRPLQIEVNNILVKKGEHKIGLKLLIDDIENGIFFIPNFDDNKENKQKLISSLIVVGGL